MLTNAWCCQATKPFLQFSMFCSSSIWSSLSLVTLSDCFLVLNSFTYIAIWLSFTMHLLYVNPITMYKGFKDEQTWALSSKKLTVIGKTEKLITTKCGDNSSDWNLYPVQSAKRNTFSKSFTQVNSTRGRWGKSGENYKNCQPIHKGRENDPVMFVCTVWGMSGHRKQVREWEVKWNSWPVPDD